MLQFLQIANNELIKIQGAAKPNAAGNGSTAVSFEEARAAAVQELNEQDVEWLKNRFRQYLESIPTDRSVVRCAVDVSDEGFEAMKSDPAYRQQIMDLVARDLGSSYAPRQASVYVKVGATLGDYRVNSWSAGDDQEFRTAAGKSFYTRNGSTFGVRGKEAFIPSAFHIFRDHLQMQLEKLDNGPATDVPRPRQITTSIYDAMGYESPAIRAFEA